MPSYLKEGRLTERDIGLIVDWIRGDTDPARWLTGPAAMATNGVSAARR
jgi:hypothetical protein